MSEWPVLQQSEDYFVEDYVANITLGTLWPIQNGRCFADNIFKHIFLDWNCLIFDRNFIEICPRGLNNNVSELDQIIAWR